jgi:predicted ATP-dependent protease
MIIPDFNIKALNLGKENIEIVRVKKVEEAFRIYLKKKTHTINPYRGFHFHFNNHILSK